ncbi:uncharacterized protein LOC21387032 isoform X1 [Morus notabilis]|uniref:uncharacterized protein LOC21387032 isoform X1 n=1 Tax=Morus notabilis TaxID=981085 RepID=UPI000CED3853|nr:uncharacterized protein LOC21387032 isoform X1 [Morus notabilis]
MEEESNAFYLVRKGEMIGIYKSLSDCQSLAGFSACDPSISVYKGYNMPKDAEDFLCSHGLKNACYSVCVNDVKDGLFGKLGSLVACPYQEPESFEVEASDDSSPERWQEAIKLMEIAETAGCSALTSPKKKLKSDSSMTSVVTPTVSYSRESVVGSSILTVAQNKNFKFDDSMTYINTQTVSLSCASCTLEFDGASKGNPGPAGAGAILRADDGSAIWRLRQGLGKATCNVAEYCSVLLGLKHALKKGFKHIRVQGDSKLVCMQISGLWKTKNQNMANLCEQARELKEKFVSFQINHVLREFNFEADAEANRAINLKDGQVEEDCQRM